MAPTWLHETQRLEVYRPKFSGLTGAAQGEGQLGSYRWFSLRTYPFQKTKRSHKRDIFKISNAFPAIWGTQNSHTDALRNAFRGPSEIRRMNACFEYAHGKMVRTAQAPVAATTVSGSWISNQASNNWDHVFMMLPCLPDVTMVTSAHIQIFEHGQQNKWWWESRSYQAEHSQQQWVQWYPVPHRPHSLHYWPSRRPLCRKRTAVSNIHRVCISTLAGPVMEGMENWVKENDGEGIGEKTGKKGKLILSSLSLSAANPFATLFPFFTQSARL